MKFPSDTTAWPTMEPVEAIGFNAAMIPILQEAIIASHVEVVGPIGPIIRGNGQGYISGEPIDVKFDYLGFRYELCGVWEFGRITVQSIEKIARVDEPEEDTFDTQAGFEGGTIVVEDYRAQRRQLDPVVDSW